MVEDTVPETPADKLESEFSCSNFAKEFFSKKPKEIRGQVFSIISNVHASITG